MKAVEALHEDRRKLQTEITKIDQALAILNGSKSRKPAKTTSKPMSAATRKRIGLGVSRRWQEKRAAKAVKK